ncbi:MMPL family transporter [Mycobacteroides abscessus]|uniref:MMPL family transporter n=1 Tax=Mycobacteroides abscessus TaxID=36809 RepID=UPI0009D1D49A|nr:MMPL family transporter [Mycobacteroides abscessus]SKT99939.1 MmpL family protein [Mycobacteroides abscessus subsp. massiliense]SKU19284.1 MmpL family protein [Mycobacteroides abscessus subsp. massiliense]
MLFTKLANLTQRVPKVILAAAVLFIMAAALFGAPVSDKLPAGGYDDPNSEASRAQATLTTEFSGAPTKNDHFGGLPLVFIVSNPSGVASPEVKARAQAVVDALEKSPDAHQIASFWTSAPAVAETLVNKDRTSALVVSQISGSDSQAPNRAHDIAETVTGTFGQTTVKAGGETIAYYQFNQQSKTDLIMIEAIAMPLTFLVLTWVFGSLIAAMVPIAVAVFAMTGTTAALRVLFSFTDVSVFALNLAVSLCLALAIDYTLLIINRFREEIADGQSPGVAIENTLATAGKTVVFSALTVALPLIVMIIFPLYFLRSLAYAGLIGLSLSVIGALCVTPSALTILGARIDKWDVRKPVHRLLGRPAPVLKVPQNTYFYRGARFAMKHAASTVVLITAFLVLLGWPVLNMKTAYPDDRLLPTSATSRQAGDILRADFPQQANAIQVVFASDSLSDKESDDYAARLSRVSDVAAVAAPHGTYVHGNRVSRDSYGAGKTTNATLFTVSSTLEPYGPAAETQISALKDVPAPAKPTFGGLAQQNIDNVRAITDRVPTAFILIAVATMVLIFLLTGSVLLPIKTVLMNILSLSAAFGAMVWIFQEGHLGGLGTTATGTINYAFPPLIFCLAFGLSMDYEVFVLSRIREEWLGTDRGPGSNETAVALGLARVGRIVTVAATVMAIVFFAIAASQVSSMRMLGVGLALTVLLDAFVIRTVLVPAFMRLLGTANWWAPGPLRRWHNKWGVTEGTVEAADEKVQSGAQSGL